MNHSNQAFAMQRGQTHGLVGTQADADAFAAREARYLREQALTAAMQTLGPGRSEAEVIKAARAIEAYLKGE